MSVFTKRVLTLGLPIIGGMVSQNILNLVDMVMIGQLGTAALAGAGIGSFLFFMSFSSFQGIANASQTMIARFVGEDRRHLITIPLTFGFIAMVFFSVLITGLIYTITPWLISLFSNESAVYTTGVDYFQFRILGLPFLTFCMLIRGFWNGVSRPMRYLNVIIVVHCINILLNYGLIFGNLGLPELGASGAGLASTIALIVGASIYFLDTFKFFKPSVIRNQSKIFLKQQFSWLVTLALPNSIQQFIFATGVSVFYWILGLLGTNEMAIGNVLVNVILVGILPGVGFGMATMTLVSESLGQKDIRLAFQWPYHAAKVAGVIIGSLCLVAMIFPRIILTPFIIDPELRNAAVLPLQIDCIAVMLEVFALIFMNALNGADQTKIVAWISSICQWIFFLPLAYLVTITFGFGLNGIWVMWGLFQGLQLSIYILFWHLRLGKKVQLI